MWFYRKKTIRGLNFILIKMLTSSQKTEMMVFKMEEYFKQLVLLQRLVRKPMLQLHRRVCVGELHGDGEQLVLQLQVGQLKITTK